MLRVSRLLCRPYCSYLSRGRKNSYCAIPYSLSSFLNSSPNSVVSSSSSSSLVSSHHQKTSSMSFPPLSSSPESAPISSSLDASLNYLLNCCTNMPTRDHLDSLSDGEAHSLYKTNSSTLLLNILRSKVPNLLQQIFNQSASLADNSLSSNLSDMQMEKVICLVNWWSILLEMSRKSPQLIGNSNWEKVNLREVEVCFRVFRGLDGRKNASARRLLKALLGPLSHVSKIENDVGILAEMVFSLQNMPSHHLEVREAVALLAHRFRELRLGGASAPPSVETPVLGRLIHGLKSMSNMHPPVNMMLEEISFLINASHSKIPSAVIRDDPKLVQAFLVNSISGLQSLTTDMRRDNIKSNRVIIDSKQNSKNKTSLGSNKLAVLLKSTRYLLHGTNLDIPIPSNITPRKIKLYGHSRSLETFLDSFSQYIISGNLLTPLDLPSLGRVCSGLKGKMDNPSISQLLLKIASKSISTEDKHFSCNPSDVVDLFAGFGHMKDDSKEVRHLMLEVAKHIDRNITAKFTPPETAAVIKSLGGMTARNMEVQYLMKVIYKRIVSQGQEPVGDKPRGVEREVERFTPRDVTDVLFGLRNMSSDVFAVRHILDFLSLQAFKCTIPFTPQEIGSCLLNLHFKSGDCVEVRRMLGALLTKLNSTEGKFQTSDLVKSICGLKSLKSDIIKVKKLINWLSIKLEASEEQLTVSDLGDCLFSLQGMSSSHSTVRKLLHTLAANQREVLTSLDNSFLGKSLFGLQNMDSRHQEVANMVKVLNDISNLSKSKFGDEFLKPFSSVSIYHACYGLRNLSNATPEVKELLSLLAERISVEGGGELYSNYFGYALFGLQNMRLIPLEGTSNTDDEVELRALLRALTQRMKSSSSCLKSPKDLRRALFGLKQICSEYSEVQDLLTVIASKLPKDSNDETALFQMSGQDICKSLYGLKNMKTDYHSVIDIVQFLTKQLRKCPDVLTAKEAADAVFGMKNMNSDRDEVVQLVDAIADRVIDCQDTMTSRDLGRVIRGFQGLSTDHIEVRKLLRAVLRKVDETDSEISPRIIEDVCLGLQRMSSGHDDVRRLLIVFEEKISRQLSRNPIVMQPKQVCNALYGMQLMTSNHAEVRRLLTVMAELLEDSMLTSKKSALTPGDISKVLRGLQHMSCAHVCVRDVLRYVTDLFDDDLISRFCKDSAAIANSLSSLRQMQEATFSPHEVDEENHTDTRERFGLRDHFSGPRVLINIIHPFSVRRRETGGPTPEILDENWEEEEGNPEV